MTPQQRPILLDLSRLVSRVGRGTLTGIDRVEQAYLDRTLTAPGPVFGLIHSAPGYVLLDRAGLAELARRLRGQDPWGPPDLIARLHLRQPAARRRALSDLRRLALGWCLPRKLREMLRRHLPAHVTYLNVGHANISRRTLAAVRTLPEARIGVLLHDTIPLDHPTFASPGVPEAFEVKIAHIARYADCCICNSDVTRRAAERHLARHGRIPPMCVAHLGITMPQPGDGALPRDIDPDRPRFVALGTIEPRKNHALLLDVWERIAQDRAAGAAHPQLVIIGARGWRNTDVFARLDSSPLMGRDIHELGPADDATSAAVLQGADALLFPSLAEGFGLPALEAAALGTPVICSDLPVFREILGTYPLYADPSDTYAWCRLVGSAMGRGIRNAGAAQRPAIPDWEAHFALVSEALDTDMRGHGAARQRDVR